MRPYHSQFGPHDSSFYPSQCSGETAGKRARDALRRRPVRLAVKDKRRRGACVGPMTSRVWLLEPRWRVVWFLTLAAALNYGDRSAMAGVLAAVRKDFGTSDVALGLIGSVFLWSYALGSPFAGNLGDRFSRTKLIRSSALIGPAK